MQNNDESRKGIGPMKAILIL